MSVVSSQAMKAFAQIVWFVCQTLAMMKPMGLRGHQTKLALSHVSSSVKRSGQVATGSISADEETLRWRCWP